MTTTPSQSLPADLVPGDGRTPRPDRRPPTQSRFRAFVDSVFDAYYDWHVHTGYMEFSAQMDTLLGLAPEALPRAFAAWLERLHPDDRAATVETVRSAVREGGVYRDEYRLRREDGSYVHVRDRGVVLRDVDGSSSHMVGAIRDVTRDLEAERALHEAAELYRTLFKNAVNSAFQIAHDGHFLDANAAGTSFMAMSRGQLLQRDVGGLWGADALEAVREATSSGVTASLELEVKVGDAVKALAVTLVPCRFRGEATCFALGTDITEHRNLRYGARGVGGLATPPGTGPVGRQHRPARHPGAAQPRQGRARAHHLGQRRHRDPAHAGAACEAPRRHAGGDLPRRRRAEPPRGGQPAGAGPQLTRGGRAATHPARARDRASSASAGARARSPRPCTSPPPLCPSTARTCAASLASAPGGRGWRRTWGSRRPESRDAPGQGSPCLPQSPRTRSATAFRAVRDHRGPEPDRARLTAPTGPSPSADHSLASSDSSPSSAAFAGVRSPRSSQPLKA